MRTAFGKQLPCGRLIFVSPRGAVLCHKKKYGAKQERYASGGKMNAKWDEVEMRTKTKKEG